MKKGYVHEIVSENAASFGAETAIERMGQQVSYEELEDRSNNLANFLISSGATKGSIVVVLIENPVEVIVSIIGILKAGCVFVPIDPGTPERRLESLVAEVSPDWFVIESRFFGYICKLSNTGAAKAKVICVDGGEVLDASPSWLTFINDYPCYSNNRNVIVRSDPDDMCYVYFTSGSTGRPKGIAGRLKSIDHFIRWEINTLSIEHGVRVSQFTTPAFDAFLRDIFVPLCAGGTICIPEERATVLDAKRLVAWIDEQRINLIHCVPSLFRSIVNEELNPADFSALKYVLLAGEPLLTSDVSKWMKVYGERIQLVNLYGPSETTMTKLFHFVRPSDIDRQAIPIGKPMEGARAVIVSTKAKSCPPGAVGEIYIRTPYRSLGYFNQPELTREVFVANPFTGDSGDIVYKTGDLGRVLGDGNFEFLGRRDRQVKIRGVRIELSEIQDLLQSHEYVKDAVIVDHDDVIGNKYLCAYVVLSGEVENGALRDYLSKSLPQHMLPSTFVTMETLPRTLSGKVNMKALPIPNQVRDGFKGPFIAPRTPIEEIVAGIWRETLRVEQASVYDNFFEMGGHSLLATQLLSRARTAFDVEVPLRSLFETPTIEGIALSIDALLRTGEKSQAPPINRAPRDANLPLSFAQQRLWFLHQMEPDSPAYNICSAVRLSGHLDVLALEQSINEVAGRHEALRTSFSEVEGEAVQVVAAWEGMKLGVEDVRHMPEQEREARTKRVIEEETQKPFDLAEGPVFRVKLLREGEQEHVLVFTMHHIVSDAWSMGVMVKEVAQIYARRVEGKESGLEELKLQYGDYAVWQREWLETDSLHSQLSYWEQQLAGAQEVIRLPGERPRLASRSYRGAAQHFTLPVALLKSLKEISQREGATLFMTMLAAFQTLLHKYTGQQDMVIGTDIANRNRGETEHLIGFFVNQLALRTDLSGNPTFLELLKRVREVTLGAYANQDLPFDKVVGALRPERSLSHTPLFQVLFVGQNTPASAASMPGLSISAIPLDNQTSKFDLILSISETEQGLDGFWRYSTDLFEEETIEKMSRHFHTLIESIVAQPDACLNKLEMQTEDEKNTQIQNEMKRKERSLERFRTLKPKVVSLSKQDLISEEYLKEGGELPLVIKPNTHSLDLAEWAGNHRPLLNSHLLRHGAILLRGFHINSPAAFQLVALALCPQLYSDYGDLPRKELSDKVYSSTPYPADQAILFHNESSQMHCWPMKIFFCCLKAPRSGGQTPLVDCRKVYERLDPLFRDKIAGKGFMYVRNFTDGLDVSWQDFFRSDDRDEVESYCRSAGMEFEWKAGGGLRTRKVCQGVAAHPQTGQMALFNQVQAHHISFLEANVRESLLKLYGEEGLPRNVYWGDGEEIDDQQMQELKRVYEQEAVSFQWEEGDVVMIENMLVAHARAAYEGDREVVVAMGEMMREGEARRKRVGKRSANAK